MSFDIVGGLEPGATPIAKYDPGFPRLYIHIENDGSTSTAQIANAINNATNMNAVVV